MGLLDLATPPRERVGLGISMGLRKSVSGTSLATDYTSSSIPPTPDLAADFYDAATQSSGPSTPPSLSPPSKRRRAKAEKDAVISHHTGEPERATPTKTKSRATTPTAKACTLLPHDISIPDPLPADSRCARCSQPLFSKKDGGKFVTVPEQPSSSGLPPKTYHTSCFRCTVCDWLFEDKDGGRAVFVRGPSGAYHVEVSDFESLVHGRISMYSCSAVCAAGTDDSAFVSHSDPAFHGCLPVTVAATTVVLHTEDSDSDIPRELAPL